MIVLEQLPLNSLDTFEEELLFRMIKAGTMSIRSNPPGGGFKAGKITPNVLYNVTVTGGCLNFLSIMDIIEKYNKSFLHPFSIEVVKDKYSNRKVLKISEE